MLALLMLVLAIGAAPMIGSADECSSTDAGRVCTTDGGVAVDGADGNADPLDGFITVDGDDACASDQGSYDDPEADRTCLSDL